MKKYISFSGGVESTAMCVLFGKDAKAIFSDTGWEHKAMYDRLATIEKQIQKIHPKFGVIKIQNEVHKRLQDYIKWAKYYPSPLSRYCTRMFKIEPIDKYLNHECELMIGLNTNERDRKGNHGLNPLVKYTYPLIDNNITREACIEILKKVDLLPVLPPYMSRGGCVGCFFKSKKEFKAMYHLNREEFNEVLALEKAIQDERGKHYHIRDGVDLSALAKQEENFLFPEVYKSELDVSTPCGVFCHR